MKGLPGNKQDRKEKNAEGDRKDKVMFDFRDLAALTTGAKSLKLGKNQSAGRYNHLLRIYIQRYPESVYEAHS